MDTLPREAWIGVVALLGLLVGSFLNVVVHRLPLEGESISKPARSRCPACRATLSWRENIPLVSWIVQRARCRHCGAGIHWRYPLIEAANALLWGLAAAMAPEPKRWPRLWRRYWAVRPCSPAPAPPMVSSPSMPLERAGAGAAERATGMR